MNAAAQPLEVLAERTSGEKGLATPVAEYERQLQLFAARGTPAWDDARAQLVESVRGLVHKLARTYVQPGVVSYEDMVQAGFEGVLNALEMFDPTRGYRFTSYAGTSARNQMAIACGYGRPDLQVPMPVDEHGDPVEFADEGPSVEDVVQSRRDVMRVRQVLSMMKPQNRLALVRKFGIGNGPEFTRVEMMSEWGKRNHGSITFRLGEAYKEFRTLMASPELA
ncbi:sigma-70 family RNA polymerase sigma factor [Ramlibacter alkalitolerans]|uniref:Sigma-70 family RNA polymerase sigma factor n=1 Tax=Ramlibacter alkalitolerans TaxID=2039631 RepID=A0ABS1JUM2_9BURK|nr:sigma-70 family RNA polymerase sigma factor [Ramlibacter alkalitolerans]MBL0427826.1 sigma-70 family RNA polymerase sigma factor [Ramlibacter alkalitolerans]